jgi:FtsH-binding integral membrane protein
MSNYKAPERQEYITDEQGQYQQQAYPSYHGAGQHSYVIPMQQNIDHSQNAYALPPEQTSHYGHAPPPPPVQTGPMIYYDGQPVQYIKSPVRAHKYQEPGDYEAPASFHVGISDKTVRRGFIRKVFSILTAQLLITMIFCIVAMKSSEVGGFLTNHMWLFYVCLFGSIAIMIALTCFPKIGRRVPLNYILLFLFTAATAYWVGTVCAIYEENGRGKYVAIAAGLTAAMTLALALFATFTKRDITTWGWGLFCLSIGAFMFMWLAIFFRTSWIYNVVLCVILVLYGIYLVYDIQLIMGNKTMKLSEDEYIIASLVIYVDIINIFVLILSLFGGSGNSN